MVPREPSDLCGVRRLFTSQRAAKPQLHTRPHTPKSKSQPVVAKEPEPPGEGRMTRVGCLLLAPKRCFQFFFYKLNAHHGASHVHQLTEVERLPRHGAQNPLCAFSGFYSGCGIRHRRILHRIDGCRDQRVRFEGSVFRCADLSSTRHKKMAPVCPVPVPTSCALSMGALCVLVLEVPVSSP